MILMSKNIQTYRQKAPDKLVLHRKLLKDIHPFIKFGMMTNNDFMTNQDIILFNTSSDKGLSTIEDIVIEMS